MHTPLILAVVAFGLTCYTLARVYSKQKQEIKMHREALEYKLVGECAKIRDEITVLKQGQDQFCAVLNYFVNRLNEVEKAATNETVETEKKLPPANRNRRTEEERRRASEIKKAWWEAKRAKEAEDKRAQEQQALTPSVVGEPLNEPLTIPS